MKSIPILIGGRCKEAWRFRLVAAESERPSPKGRRLEGEAFSASTSEVGNTPSPVGGKVALSIWDLAGDFMLEVAARIKAQQGARANAVTCHASCFGMNFRNETAE